MRVAVLVQRGLFGDLAGFVIALDPGTGHRWPLEEVDGLDEALRHAHYHMGQHGCTAVELVHNEHADKGQENGE